MDSGRRQILGLSGGVGAEADERFDRSALDSGDATDAFVPWAIARPATGGVFYRKQSRPSPAERYRANRPQQLQLSLRAALKSSIVEVERAGRASTQGEGEGCLP